MERRRKMCGKLRLNRFSLCVLLAIQGLTAIPFVQLHVVLVCCSPGRLKSMDFSVYILGSHLAEIPLHRALLSLLLLSSVLYISVLLSLFFLRSNTQAFDRGKKPSYFCNFRSISVSGSKMSVVHVKRTTCICFLDGKADTIPYDIRSMQCCIALVQQYSSMRVMVIAVKKLGRHLYLSLSVLHTTLF